jgi:DNA-directed RNA polymerase specialized sigma24 family protein
MFELVERVLEAARGSTAGLTDRELTAFDLRFRERLSFSQIGVRMDIKKGAAATMVSRALAKLRSTL